jgi:hypothetical protein
MKLISTTTVGGYAGSIVFSGVPQTGDDLLVLFSLHDEMNNEVVDLSVSFNGSTSTYKYLLGNGSSISNGSNTNNYPLGVTPGNSAGTATFSNGQIYIANYKNSGRKTGFIDSVTENNASYAGIQMTSILTTTTSAITTITLGATNVFTSGSTASLYTISTDGATGANVSTTT